MTKKYILGLFLAVLLPTTLVFASSPALTLTGSGDGSTVLINVSAADSNSNVILYFNEASNGTLHMQQVGTTDTSGIFSGSINTSTLDITAATPVHAVINGYVSNSLMWPYNRMMTVPQITFSQSNPTVNTGQSGTVTISGGNGTYYISSNSNNNVVNASLSGSTLSFSGVTSGSSVIKVCSMSESLCGNITISTNGYSTGSLSLSPSTLNLAIGQSGTTQITNGSAPYTITTTNGNGVAFSFINNSLTVSATTNGTRTLSICSSNGACTPLTVNITSSPTNTLTLTPAVVTLGTGQSSVVQVYGGTAPYSVYTISGNSVSQSISGNSVTINGTTNGVSTLNVCSANGQCATLTVTVGGSTANPGTAINFSFPLAVNEIENISLTGGNGSSYYLQSTMSSPVTATIVGSTLIVKGITYGSATVNICQSGNGTCLPITFAVNQAAAELNGTGGPFIFNNDLYIGLTNSDVAELQRILIDDNYLSSGVTGYFGDLTFAAVQKYQIANGISNTGYVGMLTRGALNR